MSCLNPSLLRDSVVPVREISQRKLPVAERTLVTLSQHSGAVLSMLAVSCFPLEAVQTRTMGFPLEAAVDSTPTPVEN